MCVTVIYCCITNHPQYLVAENNSYSFCSQNCNSGKVMTGLCLTWHCLLSGWHTSGDFPGHPAVNIALAMEGTQVRSLVGELRSHMLCSMAKIKKKMPHSCECVLTLMWEVQLELRAWGFFSSSSSGCLSFLTVWQLDSKSKCPKRAAQKCVAFLWASFGIT